MWKTGQCGREAFRRPAARSSELLSAPLKLPTGQQRFSVGLSWWRQAFAGAAATLSSAAGEACITALICTNFMHCLEELLPEMLAAAWATVSASWQQGRRFCCQLPGCLGHRSMAGGGCHHKPARCNSHPTLRCPILPRPPFVQVGLAQMLKVRLLRRLAANLPGCPLAAASAVAQTLCGCAIKFVTPQSLWQLCRRLNGFQPTYQHHHRRHHTPAITLPALPLRRAA